MLLLLLLIAAGYHHADGDTAEWTSASKARAVADCRADVVSTVLADAAKKSNAPPPDDFRAKVEASASVICTCAIDKLSAGMSFTEFTSSGGASATRPFLKECTVQASALEKAAGVLTARIYAIEDHGRFCAERFPDLAAALSEHLAVWRTEEEKVIRASSYLAAKHRPTESSREARNALTRALESLSNEKRAASCQKLVKDLEARRWREWRTDPRFQLLEEFDSRIHPR